MIPLWKNRSYTCILLGQLISEFGASLSTLANSWLLYQITGSQTAVGQMWLLYFLPSLLVQLVAGPYLDRFDKKRVMLFSQWMRCAAFGCAFLAISYAPDALWPLYLTSLINGLVQPLYVPASQSLLPTLVKQESLLQANSYLDSAMRIAMIAGPPLGGILVASIGGTHVLGLVAIGYAVSGVFLLLCEKTSVPPAKTAESWLFMFKAGLSVFREKPVLFYLSLYSALVQFAVGVTLVLNLPFVAGELHGTALHAGLFLAGYPLGYLIGTFLVPKLFNHLEPSLVMLVSLVAGGLSFVALGFTPFIELAIAIELLAGVTAPFFQLHSTRLYQLHVPAGMMGRVFSVRLLIVRTTMPIGIWLGGTLSDSVGIRPLYFAIGALIVAVSIGGIALQKFVKYRIFHV
ncbi:MFS transporter [Brevibacillus sp. HD3.3A]|uniref:MFS transporter n=1 Tax=Brevibacillus sp. HD3.3A TaxID=2738979 RepID=UPI00156BAED7|nr:MFS transporter [Brevibacillus sp. HD3.3A]UED69615.1 MFS transporter [Brevibacillus sp. HD3.3A]